MRLLFIKTTSLFALLLVNMSLYMWVFNSLGKLNLLDDNLISPARAAATAVPHRPTPLEAGVPYAQPTVSEQPIHIKTQYSEPSVLPALPDAQRFYLNFNGITIHLPEHERQRFVEYLQEQAFSRAAQVRILVGPVPSEDATLTPQTARLRAQNVARMVFPYSQNIQIKLIKGAEVKPGQVLIEFSRQAVKPVSKKPL